MLTGGGLLRQPGGFEGLTGVREANSMYHLAVPDGESSACRSSIFRPRLLRPLSRMSTNTFSPSSARICSTSTVQSSQASAQRAAWSRTAWCPFPTRPSGRSVPSHSMSLAKHDSAVSKSPARKAPHIRRTTSTFSCDIAYSDSPAASRASSSCRVLAAPRDLPVSDREDGGVSQIRLDAAQLGASAEPQDRDHLALSRVDQLDGLDAQIVERVEPVLHVRRTASLPIGPRSSTAPSIARWSMSSVQNSAKASRPSCANAFKAAPPPRRSSATSPTPTARRLRGRRPGSCSCTSDRATASRLVHDGEVQSRLYVASLPRRPLMNRPTTWSSPASISRSS